MLKKIAKIILKEELKLKEATIKRQDDLSNLLVQEIEKLKRNIPIRGYVLDVDKLTEDEQKILGSSHEHPVVNVLKKSFKAKADENNDKLVHFQEESEGKRMQWSLAIRIYDDLVMQLNTLKRFK